ncbi:hypothetical protein AJ78_05664 [Emergomyces pasteurianus Ep9510]|uniref:Uncharacterized protein n=1 Tax=Emergomyces pasteurianus Ep9510 TaxID=1447872 RepID=A0A1J9QCT1_9EURO|nr:hypothetical protein AJ78_05664 [Emergomyces pasteurianus Ep9510]
MAFNQAQLIQTLTDQVNELVNQNRIMADANARLSHRLETLKASHTANEPQLAGLIAQSSMPATKVKLRKPDVFDDTTDICFWLLNIDDNICERLITNNVFKIAFDISYLSLKIRQHVQSLTAELCMNLLCIQYNQHAVNFIVNFKTITADLK